MIWREKQLLIVVLAALLIANLIYFFTYRVQFEERLRDYDTRAAQSEGRLEQARTTRVGLERQLAGYRKLQKDIQDVYDNRWSTQTARLAPLIAEVKRLATASQLIPQTYSFGQSAGVTAGAGPSANVVGITFNVAGTYQQVRRLINLLELSQQFVIIEGISLNSTNEGLLTLGLRVKTLFRGADVPVAPRANRTS
jgi:Tfp pilus assembly protein PilO